MPEKCDQCRCDISPDFARRMSTCQACCMKYAAEQTTPMIAHVYTLNDGHVTSGIECWCEPILYRNCSQCEDRDPDCWLCEGTGVVAVDDPIPNESLMVVHNFIPDDAVFETPDSHS